MDSANRDRIAEIFHAALERSPEERSDFVAAACRGDNQLRAEIDSLLSKDRCKGILDEPLTEGMIITASGMDEHSARPILTPQELVSGRFRVAHFIGRGGMGEVYAAEDLELHVRVALKTIRAEISTDTPILSRFKREIQLARGVPN